jgi:beta-glucosidase
MANLMRAHAIVREVFHGRPGTRGIPLGISTNMVAFAPERRWHPLDLALTPLIDALYNHAGFEALTRGELVVNVPGLANARAAIEGGRRSMDFLGVNYYSRAHLRFTTGKPYLQYSYRDPHRRGLTDLGWEYYPEGFGQVLRQLKRYDLPVWVTENGLDDRTGARRSGFLYDHWRELLGAVADGVPVSHYFHWALMDNFEWLEAWGPRFGLYQVDFDTLERRPGPACAYFHQVATTGRLVAPPSAGPA